MKKIIIFLIILISSFTYVNAEELSCTTTLSKGMKGTNVKTLQKILNEQMNCSLQVDGTYGKQTKSCVSKFQAKNNLSETGTVNKSTCSALNNLNKSLEENSCSETLKIGSSGQAVKTLQTKLNQLTTCNLEVDGKYGNKTKSCVMKFQIANNIAETGIVNKTTCQAIKEQEERKKDSFCSNTLKKGNKGDSVKKLQIKLNNVMNCSLEIDGKYGNLTKACVMKFQMNLGLNVTGVVDGTTCNRLIDDKTTIEKEKKLKIEGTSLILTKDNVKIRKNKSLSSKEIKIGSFGEIYQYKTTYRTDGITWYQVKIGEQYGYVEEKYISKDFIVVDKSQQKLIFYKNKEIILNTEVVTGMYENHDTPTGYYKLETKNLVAGKYLRGYNDDGTKYKSWVDYWMPFITSRGIGFHDATWRTTSEFTDYRYLYDGSHGCVNMKKEAAKTLFTNITEDVDVIIRN